MAINTKHKFYLHRITFYISVPIKDSFPFWPVPLYWLIAWFVMMALITVLQMSPALLPPLREAKAFTYENITSTDISSKYNF